jgi:hypothetical protein
LTPVARASRARVQDASGVRFDWEARRFLTRTRDAWRYDADDLRSAGESWRPLGSPVAGVATVAARRRVARWPRGFTAEEYLDRPIVQPLMNTRLACLCWVFAMATWTVLARSGASQIAWPGKSVQADTGWPAGAVELINDPTRTEGWNPWFSGTPSDVRYFVFKLTNQEDASRLVDRLAAIQAPVQLVLSPEREPLRFGFTSVLKPSNGLGALFSLGNQRVLNEWRSVAAKYPQKPQLAVSNAVAQPPVLTLFVGNPMIDLKKLRVPRHVKVSAAAPDLVRQERPDDRTLLAIEEFLSNRR